MKSSVEYKIDLIFFGCVCVFNKFCNIHFFCCKYKQNKKMEIYNMCRQVLGYLYRDIGTPAIQLINKRRFFCCFSSCALNRRYLFLFICLFITITSFFFCLQNIFSHFCGLKPSSHHRNSKKKFFSKYIVI